MHEPNSPVEPAAVESSAPSVPASDNSTEDQPTADSPRSSMAPVEVVSDTIPEHKARIWFRRGDQLFIGVMVIAVIVLMAVHWMRLSGWAL